MVHQALCVILEDKVESLKICLPFGYVGSFLYFFLFGRTHTHTQRGIRVLWLDGNVCLFPRVCKGPVNPFFARFLCALVKPGLL